MTQSIFGHHRLMPSSWNSADAPLSAMRALEAINNAGHLHDESFRYKVSQYGVGAASTGTTNPYVWSSYFPMTLTHNGNMPNLHARVAVYTQSGTLSTTLRIVPADAPWPAVDDSQSLCSYDGTDTTSAAGELVIDAFLGPQGSSRSLPVHVVPVKDGDGTGRGIGTLFMVRADLIMTLAGSAGGSYFGAGEVQIREYVHTL